MGQILPKMTNAVAKTGGPKGGVEGIRPDEEPVSKTGGGASRLGVRVPRLPL